jgi:hypothetical protein
MAVAVDVGATGMATGRVDEDEGTGGDEGAVETGVVLDDAVVTAGLL